MKSKWYKLKEKAIKQRRLGDSIRDIENNLGIPRSTLSNWFKGIRLNSEQKRILMDKHKENLVKARAKAVIWHNQQKETRLMNAESEADKVISNIKEDNNIIELALALLYLGEGFKKSPVTGMGNSDPLVLKFFLRVLMSIYKIKIENIRLDLHLRADQDGDTIKAYWAKELNLPINRIKHVTIDRRTLGKPTYTNYKGVCSISCGNVAIQRKLVYIGRKFCEKVVKIGAISSVGRAQD